MKRLLLTGIALLMALALAGCAKKVVHCDGCGNEIEVPAGSDMTEDWLILCEECKAKLGE